jgi:signal transduction histidine kinase
VVKHSQAQQVGIDVSRCAGTLRLQIVDDGTGFNPQLVAIGQGLGLINMRDRLHLLNGELEINSNPSGTQIKVHIPLADANG